MATPHPLSERNSARSGSIVAALGLGHGRSERPAPSVNAVERQSVSGVHTIAKRFTFSASHHLPGLPSGHKCGRLHGHNYTVELVLGCDALVEPGFVTDFADLAPMKEYLDVTFDHRDLNEVLDGPPTSERLAEHFARWAMDHLEPVLPGRVLRVRVSETDSTWAEYTPDRSA